ncbi:MAG: EVE domain-containing protein [Holdemanella sp.]|nr:EVE domain-containing protein [Holdemanella sp.]
MKTWLFTWNKEKFEWNDALYGYHEMMDEIHQIGYSFCKWNCHSNKSFDIGDRFFLIKLGSYPKGIIGSGTIASNYFDGSHPYKENTIVKRVYLKFDRIYDYETDSILDYNELLKIDDSFNWLNPISGTIIPASISKVIERKWEELDSEHFLKNFGVEFIKDRVGASKNIILKEYIPLLSQYDFRCVKISEQCIEYKNIHTQEIVYMVLQDRLNIVTQPSIYMDRYIGFAYHNSLMNRFPKRSNKGKTEIYYGTKYDFINTYELETFLKDFNKETREHDYQVKNTWILSVSPNIYDHVSSFNKNGFIDWRQHNNFEIGDMVMIYSSSPKKRIIACAQIIKTDMPKEEKIDDRKFWYKESDYLENESKNRFVRLKLRYFVNNDKLTFSLLKQNGMKNAPQCAMIINDTLHDYIYTTLEND